MNWKEFFKPSIFKIILTFLISFIIFAFPRYGEYYGYTCPINVPCKPDIGFVFFSGFYFLGSLFHVESLLTLVFMLITTLIFSYMLSCLIIHTFYKFKK